MSIEDRIPDNLVTTDWASLNTAQRIKHLEIEGYVLILDLLSKDQVAIIKEELDRLPTTATDYSENQRGYSHVQWTDSPNAIDVIGLPAMADFLAALFGDEILCTSYIFSVSKLGHPGIAIHTDSQPYGSAILGLQASAPKLVRVLYYLDDLTPKRSHLSLHADANPYNRFLSHPEEVMVTCKAGSAAIINQQVFHGNYPNRSQEDRRMLAVAYRPAWAGPIFEIPDWDQESVAALPDHIRPFFKSLNTRKIDFNVGNRPPNMAEEAPGINPSRWDV